MPSASGSRRAIGGTELALLAKVAADVLRAHCDDGGRDYDAIEKTAHFPIVTSQDPSVVEAVRGGVARHLRVPPDTIRREAPIGSRDFVQESLRRYAELGVREIALPVITRTTWTPWAGSPRRSRRPGPGCHALGRC